MKKLRKSPYNSFKFLFSQYHSNEIYFQHIFFKNVGNFVSNLNFIQSIEKTCFCIKMVLLLHIS
jgi:pantothenate kinase